MTPFAITLPAIVPMANAQIAGSRWAASACGWLYGAGLWRGTVSVFIGPFYWAVMAGLIGVGPLEALVLGENRPVLPYEVSPRRSFWDCGRFLPLFSNPRLLVLAGPGPPLRKQTAKSLRIHILIFGLTCAGMA